MDFVQQAARGLFLPEAFLAKQRMLKKRMMRTAAYGLKKHITRMIQQAYPEHLFTVEVQPETGHIIIDHPLLAKAEARYFCRYNDFEQSQGKAVIKLCGEILERANMPRSELKYYEDYDDVRVVDATKTQFNQK
jgi:hypothetical protein